MLLGAIYTVLVTVLFLHPTAGFQAFRFYTVLVSNIGITPGDVYLFLVVMGNIVIFGIGALRIMEEA